METSLGEVRRGSGTDDYQPTHVVQGLILIQGLNARKLAPFGGGGGLAFITYSAIDSCLTTSWISRRLFFT